MSEFTEATEATGPSAILGVALAGLLVAAGFGFLATGLGFFAKADATSLSLICCSSAWPNNSAVRPTFTFFMASSLLGLGCHIFCQAWFIALPQRENKPGLADCFGVAVVIFLVVAGGLS